MITPISQFNPRLDPADHPDLYGGRAAAVRSVLDRFTNLTDQEITALATTRSTSSVHQARTRLDSPYVIGCGPAQDGYHVVHNAEELFFGAVMRLRRDEDQQQRLMQVMADIALVLAVCDQTEDQEGGRVAADDLEALLSAWVTTTGNHPLRS